MQTKATRSVVDEDVDTDQAVLTMLLADPIPWKVDEVLREMRNSPHTEDSLARLQAGGLIHRIGDEFVFPTRAAARASALAG